VCEAYFQGCESVEVAIYKLSLQTRLKSLDTVPISDVNKKLIFDFVDHCFTERLSQHRILKYISALKAIALKIQLDFDKIEKRDLFIFIFEHDEPFKQKLTLIQFFTRKNLAGRVRFFDSYLQGGVLICMLLPQNCIFLVEKYVIKR
jgi:hypothetical protein